MYWVSFKELSSLSYGMYTKLCDATSGEQPRVLKCFEVPDTLRSVKGWDDMEDSKHKEVTAEVSIEINTYIALGAENTHHCIVHMECKSWRQAAGWCRSGRLSLLNSSKTKGLPYIARCLMRENTPRE